MRRMLERESCFGALQGCNSIVFHRIPFYPPKFINTMEYVFGILYSPSRLPTLYLLRPSNSSQRLTPRCIGAWSRVTFPRPQPWALVATQNALQFQHL